MIYFLVLLALGLGVVVYLVKKGKIKDSDGDLIPDAVEDKVEDVKEVVQETKRRVKRVKEEIKDVPAAAKGNRRRGRKPSGNKGNNQHRGRKPSSQTKK